MKARIYIYKTVTVNTYKNDVGNILKICWVNHVNVKIIKQYYSHKLPSSKLSPKWLEVNNLITIS